MAGRKPLCLRHVDETQGSPRAKRRVRAFIQTLCGTLDLAAACQATDLHASQFHEVRREWLQAAVALEEPRPVGRPALGTKAKHSAAEVERLTSENAELRRQVATLQQRIEIERILAAGPAPLKKTIRSP